VLWRKAGAPTVTPQTFISRVSRRGYAYQKHRTRCIGRTYNVSPDGSRFLMFKPDRQPTFSVVLRSTQTLADRSNLRESISVILGVGCSSRVEFSRSPGPGALSRRKLSRTSVGVDVQVGGAGEAQEAQ
jgi:hypothetical protein